MALSGVYSLLYVVVYTVSGGGDGQQLESNKLHFVYSSIYNIALRIFMFIILITKVLI